MKFLVFHFKMNILSKLMIKGIRQTCVTLADVNRWFYSRKISWLFYLEIWINLDIQIYIEGSIYKGEVFQPLLKYSASPQAAQFQDEKYGWLLCPSDHLSRIRRRTGSSLLYWNLSWSWRLRVVLVFLPFPSPPEPHSPLLVPRQKLTHCESRDPF